MSQKNYNIEIIHTLLRSENHIRGLAKILKTNQTTISRKTKELAGYNVVDFKEQGKNKIAFLKKTLEAKQYACIAELYKAIEIIKRYPLLRRIFTEIKRDNEIHLAALFGSYAKGIAKDKSDIDIYIDATKKEIKERIELLDSSINVKIGRYNKESPLIKEIEKNHIIIKGVEAYYEKSKFFD